MHELTVVSNIFKIILATAEENKLSKISKINLKVGKQRHLAPDLMKFAFDSISGNTIAAGAELEIERVDITMECRSCSHVFTVEDNTYMCISCGSALLKTLSGKDLLIESIEGEV
ncbi:MAG: hydrogenase maturation nickel metallochaperone HypA [Spirochaetales bacterium]|nr:hydrogenase maturation nickel metallochaperone HypA [Spirochaetales bacterium]